ncbi:hypothetical protein HDV64DRAFT_50960 [Trichoderma sp. TUCIM 5745]
MHCNANSSASSASHHPLRAATGTGHKRATPSGPGALLKAAASRASFFCSSLASAFYHLFVFLLLFVRHFLNSHLVSSLPSPRPQTALRSRSTDCLLWPTSPDGTRSSLLSSYPPRTNHTGETPQSAQLVAPFLALHQHMPTGVRALLQRWPAICLNWPPNARKTKVRPCLVAPNGGNMVDETSPESSM